MMNHSFYHFPGIFLASLLVLFLCQSSFVSAESNPTKKLNWIGHWKGEDKRELLVEEIKKEYEFLHPNVEINLVYDVDLKGPGSYYKKKTAYEIAQMIQTGSINWDIIFLGVTVYNYVAEILDDPLWGEKHLVDFTKVPGFLECHKTFIVNTPHYKNQTGGIYVGPFVEGFIHSLWYNKIVAKKIGIDIRERGMTVKDFLHYAQQLSIYNEANNTSIPFLNLNSFYRIESLFEYIFKSHFNDPDSVIELSYSLEKARAFFATLKIFEKLAQYQPTVNPGWRNLDFVQYQKNFLDGGGLFIPGGTYMYGHFKGNAPDTMKNGIPIESPTVKQPNGLVGQYSNVFAVMKNSPNKKEALDLIQLWSEPKIADKWVRYTKNPTGLKGNLVEINRESMDDVYAKFVMDMTSKYKHLPMRNYRKPSYVFGKECKITGISFRENLALILEGKLKAKDYYLALMNLHKRFDNTLDN